MYQPRLGLLQRHLVVKRDLGQCCQENYHLSVKLSGQLSNLRLRFVIQTFTTIRGRLQASSCLETVGPVSPVGHAGKNLQNIIDKKSTVFF